MKISVIIPTLNEAAIVESAIRCAWASGADEVIVCDGGSTDATVAIASKSNCTLVHSKAGRGIQLNAGADTATGDVYLFLHADTWLTPDGCQQVRHFLSRGRCSAGAFHQRIESERIIYRLIEQGNGWRVAMFSMAYGDQGIFVTKTLFRLLRGFQEVSLMEDFDFSRRLKKHCRYKLLAGPLHVSPRRWVRNGPLRQTLCNWKTVWAYCRGANTEELARKYQQGNR